MGYQKCKEWETLLDRPIEKMASEEELRDHLAQCVVCKENSKNFKPIKVKGEPLSETIKKDRR